MITAVVSCFAWLLNYERVNIFQDFYEHVGKKFKETPKLVCWIGSKEKVLKFV